MSERVYEARTSNESAYSNTPQWLNLPTIGAVPTSPVDRHVALPPGRHYDPNRNPGASGSGFPPMDQPILEFERKPVAEKLIDVYWHRRNTWAIADRAKPILSQMDPNAFEFSDTVTRAPRDGRAPHYWLCDVVQFRDALDLSGPEVYAKPYDEGLLTVNLVGARNLRFRRASLGSAQVWRLHQANHSILCTETAYKIWMQVRPKLRGIRWELVGATDV